MGCCESHFLGMRKTEKLYLVCEIRVTCVFVRVFFRWYLYYRGVGGTCRDEREVRRGGFIRRFRWEFGEGLAGDRWWLAVDLVVVVVVTR